MNITQAPIKDPISDQESKAVQIWQDWFNSIGKMLGVKRNQENVAWTPVASGLTYSVSGTNTGIYTQKDNIVYFNITLTPSAGTSTSVLNTTKITNLPKLASGYWFGNAFMNTGYVDLGRCLIKTATNEIYLPDWTTIAGSITISGNYITNE